MLHSHFSCYEPTGQNNFSQRDAVASPLTRTPKEHFIYGLVVLLRNDDDDEVGVRARERIKSDESALLLTAGVLHFADGARGGAH